MTEARRIPTFFYGSFINPDVLERGGFVPSGYEVCTLDGYDIRIDNLATLVSAPNATVYGILAFPTHQELASLYGQGWLGGSYAPEPVAVRSESGAFILALCFIAVATPGRPADDYLDWIVGPARRLGFPDWYVERIERWRDKALQDRQA